MSDDSWIVEFVGLPGSGKSTLSHAVAERLRGQGELVSEPSFEITRGSGGLGRKLRKAGFAAATLLRQPGASLRALRTIRSSEQRSFGDVVRIAFNMLYVCGLQAEAAARPGIHLLDQGFFQALWSVEFGARQPGSESRLADLLRQPNGAAAPPARGRADQVVVLDPDPDSAVARMGRRRIGGSRLDARLGQPDFVARLEAALAAHRHTRRLLECLAESGLDLSGVDASCDHTSPEFERLVHDLSSRVLRARARRGARPEET